MDLSIKDIAEGVKEINDDKEVKLSVDEQRFVDKMQGLFKTFDHKYMTSTQRRQCLDLLEKHLILDESPEAAPILPREPEEFEVDLEEANDKDGE